MSKGFTLIELLVTISIVSLISTLAMILIDPLNLILTARDGTRVNSVDIINKAIQAYATTNEAAPECDKIGTCPMDFELTGSDPVSQLLVEGHYLKTVPTPPENPTNDNLCDYHIYLYKNSNNEYDYLVRWCFESWSKSDVDRVSNPNYYCEWNDTEKVAVCYTNRIYGIPPAKQ